MIPRDAATVLIVRDDPLRVLMMRRPPTGMFASALVFPGGAVEPSDADPDLHALVRGGEDDRVARIAGIRETYEEVALLLGGAAPPPGATAFPDAVRTAGGLDLDVVVPIARWVTPSIAPRRWDTRFFVARAPADHDPVPDGAEALTADWVEPAAVLAAADAGDERLPFPTRVHLRWLALGARTDDALARAAARTGVLVQPEVEQRDGRRWVRIPDGTDYDLTEGEVDLTLPG